MTELFQIVKGLGAQPIVEFPFSSELGDLETFIKNNPQLLGESMEILGEQIDTGTGDRVDLLALDKTVGTGQITIIELKNDIAKQSVLLQILRYANWIKRNPDSIKYLLEKKKLTTEEIDLNPKIMVVAPQIEPALLAMSQYIQAFDFDFIELRRFGTKENCYLVTDHKTPSEEAVPEVRSQQEWNWERYQADFDVPKDQIEIGKALVEALNRVSQERNWKLNPKFRKGFIGFQFGSRNVIFINYWFPGKACHLGFKLGQSPEKLSLNEPYPSLEHKYSSNYKDYYVKIDKSDIDVTGYIPFMEAAYRNVTKE